MPARLINTSFLLPPVEVALIVEVTEEDDQGDAVTEHQQVHGVGEVALCEQVVAGVQEEEHKLHLERQTTDLRYRFKCGKNKVCVCRGVALTSWKDVR